MSTTLKIKEPYFSNLAESTIKKAKSLSKIIQFENDSPLIEGSGGNVYSITINSKDELYCFCIHDESPCEGWKFSKNIPKECKHILALRINQGQTISYLDKEGNKKEISNTVTKKNKINIEPFEVTNRFGEKFLMKKLPNGTIETLKYLGKNGKPPEEQTICNYCNHSKISHQSKRKGGCIALQELQNYFAVICGCTKC